jgi:hypothetical protein
MLAPPALGGGGGGGGPGGAENLPPLPRNPNPLPVALYLSSLLMSLSRLAHAVHIDLLFSFDSYNKKVFFSMHKVHRLFYPMEANTLLCEARAAFYQ